MPNDCIFCKIAQGKMQTDLLYQSEEIVAFRDINPQAPVHILIITKRHIPKVQDMQKLDTPLIGEMVRIATQLAQKEKIAAAGYRLVINCGKQGGQEVDHLHLHLLGGRPMQWPPG